MFRWFEDIVLLKGAQSDWNEATKIKVPKGSIYEKYMSPVSWSREDQTGIFWVFLVEFKLRIMLKEGICEVGVEISDLKKVFKMFFGGGEKLGSFCFLFGMRLLDIQAEFRP